MMSVPVPPLPGPTHQHPRSTKKFDKFYYKLLASVTPDHKDG